MALTFALTAVLATTGAGRSGAGAVVLQVAVMTLLAGSAISCLVRGALRASERNAWLAIGLGFVAWFGGDFVYWTSLLPPITTDVAYFVFYGLASVGIALLVRATGVGWSALVDAAIAVAGMTTLWTWLVWDRVHPHGVASTVSMTIYPIADLVLAAAAVGAMQATRWPLASRWFPIAAGFAAIGAADSVWLIAAAKGTYLDGTPLDLVWPAGAVCVGLAAWLPMRERQAASFTTGTVSVAIAGCAGLSALIVLISERFERLPAATLAAATATIVLGAIRALTSHFLGVAGERSLRLAATQMVHALATTVDAKDPYTRNHSSQVALYARAIGARLGLTGERLDRIAIAGELHDIGKIAVPDWILVDERSLTRDAFEAIKRHPTEGERIVRNAGLDDIAGWIRHHHERWDGSGYPDGAKGDEASLEARILAIADSLDAMTTNRSYHPARSVEQAKREILRAAGTQFDPAVAEVVVAMIDDGSFAALHADIRLLESQPRFSHRVNGTMHVLSANG